MISSTCKTCWTTHFSDEAHVGKLLKCAGCGKPVLIEAKADIEIPSPTQYRVRRTPKQDFSILIKRYRFVGTTVAIIGIILFLSNRYLHIPEGVGARGGDAGVPPTPRTSSSSPTSHSPVDNDLGFRPASSTATDPPYTVAGPDLPSVPQAVQTAHSRHDTFDDVDENSRNNKAPANSARSLAQDTRPYNPTHLNGERLDDDSQSGGHGEFDVSNHKNLDAVVIMIDTDSQTTSAKLYLQRQGDSQISRIKPGSYEIHITEGLDWDDALGQFKTDSAYFKLPTPVTFDERDTGTKIVFHHVSITLHTVLNGNLKQIPIPKEDFWPRGSPERIRLNARD